MAWHGLRKAFEKQIKTIEGKGRKKVEALKVLKPGKNQEDLKSIEGILPKGTRTNEIKNKIDENKKWEESFSCISMYMIISNMKR